MTLYKQWIAAGCCLVLALLVGCGSGDDGPSKEEFASQANAVCFKANSTAGSKLVASYELPKVKNATRATNSEVEVEVYLPILVKDAESQLKGIKALGAPSDEEEEVEALTKSYEAWLKKAEEVPAKVTSGNDIYNDARELAGKMGLAKCEQTPFEEPYALG